MSNLPVDPYDRTVIVETDPNNPDRAPLMGTGRDIVVSMNPPSVVGREKMFLASDGKWVPFTTTEFTSWGAIIGNIQDQADLQAEFALYTPTANLAPVALTGAYGSLSGKPPLGDVSAINTNGLNSYYLSGDGQWRIPTDVNAVWGNILGDINNQGDLIARLGLKANILNPTFTGTVVVPSPPVDDNSGRAATTSWFFGQAFNGVPVMDGLASSGASTLWARGDHRHPTDDTRAPLDAPLFTGNARGVTPAYPNNTVSLATTEYVTQAIAGAGLTPPPSDGKMYAMLNGVWTEIGVGTKWDQTI